MGEFVEWGKGRTHVPEGLGGRAGTGKRAAKERLRQRLFLFSVHFFRRFFQAEWHGISQAAGRPLSASMPNRAKSGIRARFP